jgi:hypothetical protein
MVEAQHVLSTAKLVDDAEEQELLETLIDRAKPSLPDTPEFAPPGAPPLHYLLATPFRYPPLRHGSRFGSTHERGIWYGARHLDTVLAEVAFYRLLFLAGTKAVLAPIETTHTAYSVPVKSSRAVDLSRGHFDGVRGGLLDPSSHAAGRAFGTVLREASVELLLFPSARDPEARANAAVFSPRAFAGKGTRAGFVPDLAVPDPAGARDVLAVATGAEDRGVRAGGVLGPGRAAGPGVMGFLEGEAGRYGPARSGLLALGRPSVSPQPGFSALAFPRPSRTVLPPRFAAELPHSGVLGLGRSPPETRIPARRSVAQPGSAPAWGAGGRRFKSSRSDHSSCWWARACGGDSDSGAIGVPCPATT